MRSAGGTKSGEPCFVTRSTNVTIAFLGAVLFQDGSGSWARPGTVQDVAISAMAARRVKLIWNLVIEHSGQFHHSEDRFRPSRPRANVR
jgi:hypothetical protein